MFLIINADDFGITRPVNEAIRELAEIGTLSSTTVMVNMPFAMEIESLINIDNFGIGLHFNLTQGQPLTNPSEILSLVDDNGFFLNVHTLKSRIKQNKLNRTDVVRELHSQFTWLKERVGNRLTHIDSHQEINKLEYVSGIISKFSQGLNYRYGLRVYNKSYLSVSNGVFKIDNPGLFNSSKYGFRRCLVETYFRVRNRKIEKYYSLPDGMLFTRDNSTRALLKTLLVLDSTDFDNKCYEIMCHPAISIEGLSETKMLQSRVEEYEILKSEQFKSFLRKVKLINFSQIPS